MNLLALDTVSSAPKMAQKNPRLLYPLPKKLRIAELYEYLNQILSSFSVVGLERDFITTATTPVIRRRSV